MALDSPPWLIDGTTVDGEVIRRAVGSLINPAGGIVTPGDLAVTQQTVPNMSVQVGTGQIWVPGTSTASQGLYYAENKAAVTLAIAASNPSNPRLDQVICQVEDAAYAGSSKLMQFAVVTGTPTSGASLSNLVGLGSVPASSLVIAYVLVPAGTTSIVTADIGNVAPVCSRASGPWVPLTLASGIVSGSASPPATYVPSARLAGDKVELKGTLVNSTGSGITSVATIPSAAMYPSAVVVFITGVVQIGTTHQIEVVPNLGAGDVLGLDGLSYSLS